MRGVSLHKRLIGSRDLLQSEELFLSRISKKQKRLSKIEHVFILYVINPEPVQG